MTLVYYGPLPANARGLLHGVVVEGFARTSAFFPAMAHGTTACGRRGDTPSMSLFILSSRVTEMLWPSGTGFSALVISDLAR